MRWIWLIILAAVPAAEIFLIALMGQWIGGLKTFALLVLMGLLGVWLMKRESLRALHEFRERLASGEAPGLPLLDGLCVLAGGILLIIPGFLTDAAGLVLLIPPTRAAVCRWLVGRLRRLVERGQVTVLFRRR